MIDCKAFAGFLGFILLCLGLVNAGMERRVQASRSIEVFWASLRRGDGVERSAQRVSS